MDVMLESPENKTSVFMDGSYLTNPGSCGTGAVLYPPHFDPFPLKKPVTMCEEIYYVRGTCGGADSSGIFSQVPSK